jgi:hypothetical protein
MVDSHKDSPLILKGLNSNKMSSNTIEMSAHLQNSVRLINDFCADTETFSFAGLSAFKFKGLCLKANPILKELTLTVCSEQDYQAIQWLLTPGKRLYQLLGIHFKQVHIAFSMHESTLEHNVLLETIPLKLMANSLKLRETSIIGTKLRRAMNIALQGHISILKIHDGEEVKALDALLQRERVIKIFEQYQLSKSYSEDGMSVKMWRANCRYGCRDITIIVD